MSNQHGESQFYWITFPDWVAGAALLAVLLVAAVAWLVVRRRRAARR